MHAATLTADPRPRPPGRAGATTSADFEAMVREHGPRLLAVARRFLRVEDDARDAVQDAFLNAYRARASFNGEASVGTWLHRILVNACLMRLRTRRRRPEHPIEDLLPAFLDDGHHQRDVGMWEDPEWLLARSELQALVRKCIDALPDACRTTLLLRDMEGMSTEETARALGISEGAAKLRLHRARLALRGLLAPFFEVRRAATGA
jgi:RNA polymerase sigma-70 factor, ECF subfamily